MQLRPIDVVDERLNEPVGLPEEGQPVTAPGPVAADRLRQVGDLAVVVRHQLAQRLSPGGTDGGLGADPLADPAVALDPAAAETDFTDEQKRHPHAHDRHGEDHHQPREPHRGRTAGSNHDHPGEHDLQDELANDQREGNRRVHDAAV